jgi:prepilin-type N-terminal cleavage/methylation domain-containing protein
MRNRRPHSGFTLIELIVVIGIIMVLATIAVLFLPGIMERQRASSGASQLQSWLLIAKQRALRDQAPRGVRLNVNGTTVTDLQFIEAPPDFSGGSIQSIAVNGGVTTVTFQGVDLTAGGQVQQGDYLEINGGGQTYEIAGVGVAGNTLTLTTTPQLDTSNFTPTTKYRIIRQAREVTGEDALQLPQDVAIDLTQSRAGGTGPGNAMNTLFSGQSTIDILFDRNGTVIGDGSSYDKFILWVKDVTLPPTEGDQTLVTVYTRTGNIESHPVNLDANIGGGDPYYFVKEGKSSGE